jgi:serine/threonine-protein kinase
MNADRNLLFGILALQLNFIDREALLAAFDRWIGDKNKPLGDILVEMGKLDGEHRELLDGLVAAHLKLHDDNPEKSLAAISSLGSVRADLGQIADPDVQASLAGAAKLLPTNPDDQDPIGTTDSAGTRSSSGLRFTILRPHARGGLGQVSVALDEELNREVAFKEIQEQYADDAVSRARFVLEAEVTGGLEHPGIVPIYGLGRYGNGRPFYAMRFVQGDSLQAAIKRYHQGREQGIGEREQALEFRRLLGRLIDVCNAIEYAHSRRVLHRDLKPGNIMLGRYGETLVVDWGLAKPLGHRPSPGESQERTLLPALASDSGHTQMGLAIGTPQYMSPEQAKGQLDKLGPATDVYSLGATLYCLLTGQAPFGENEDEATVARVARGDFPPPSKVEPGVPCALQAVCLKAMALEPDDRYRSVRALADDIEHWLADEPVSALAETRWTQLARWTRRHRAWTRAGAAALVVVATTAVVAALLVDDQRRRADDNAKRAEIRRKEAANIATLAGQAVNDFSGRLNQDPRIRARDLEDLRMDLLRTAVGYYEAIIAAGGESPDMREEQAKARGRLAEITAETNSRAKAVELYEAARRELQALVSEFPATTSHRRSLAVTEGALANSYRDTGEAERAEAAYRAAIESWEGIASGDQVTPEDRQSLAGAYGNIAAFSLQAGRVREATDYYTRARLIEERLVKLHPENPQFARDLAATLRHQSLICAQTGKTVDAEKLALGAVEIEDDLVARFANQDDYQGHLAATLTNLALIYTDLGHPNEAVAAYRRAVTIQKRLVDAHPLILANRKGLAATCNNLGTLLADLGRLDEAQREFSAALELRESLASADPQNTAFAHDLAGTWSNLAKINDSLGLPGEASEAYARAKEIREQLAERGVPPSDDAFQHAMTLSESAKLHASLGRVADARRAFDEAIRTLSALAQRQPNMRSYRLELSRCYNNLAVLAGRMNDWKAAEDAYGESVKRCEQLVRDEPDVVDHEIILAGALEGLGTVYHATRRFADAERSYTKGIEVLARVVDACPLRTDYTLKLVRARNNLGSLYGMSGQIELARRQFLQAQETCDELSRRGLKSPEHRHLTANACNALAVAYTRFGQRAEALAEYRKATEMTEELVREFPTNVDYAAALGLYYGNLGDVSRDPDMPQPALEWYVKSVDQLEALFGRRPDQAVCRQYLVQSHEKRADFLGGIDRHAEALLDWERAAELSSGAPSIRMRLALCLVQLRRVAQAVAIADALSKLDRATPADCYNLSCVYALALAASDDEHFADQCSERAIALLNRSRRAGFFDDAAKVEHLRNDPDFAGLRGRDDFRKFFEELVTAVKRDGA